jgi:hypothetical protein
MDVRGALRTTGTRLATRRSRGLPPAPFVIGSPHSGTTLLRLMLDSHPDLAIPSETHFVPRLIEASKQPGTDAHTLAALLVEDRRWPDFGLDERDIHERFAAIHPFNVSDALRAFYHAYADRQGKPRWGDKTPQYYRRRQVTVDGVDGPEVRYVNPMRLIDHHLPEAHFVHLIRDGRDVMLSRWDYSDRSLRYHARAWRNGVRTARSWGPKVSRYIEVRYEDLVLDTQSQLQRICDFLALEFHPDMLKYYERAGERIAEVTRRADERRTFALTTQPPRTDRVGRWRRQLPPDEQREFERVAGDLLAELGYEVGSTRPPNGDARAPSG